MDPTVLSDAIERLRATERLSGVQETIRTAARRIVGADGATFVLRDHDRCFYADEDAMSPLWKGQRFPLSDCISGWAMLHAETAIVPDITRDERIPLDAYRPTFVKSLVMVPIGRGRPVGAIGAYWAHAHEAGSGEVALLEGLAGAAADAIARVGLQDAPFLPPSLVSSPTSE
jgi:GAF domain-containing protein